MPSRPVPPPHTHADTLPAPSPAHKPAGEVVARAVSVGSREVVPSAESSRHRTPGAVGAGSVGAAEASATAPAEAHPPQTHAETVAQFAPDGNPYAAITAQYHAQLPGLAALLQQPGVMVLRSERNQVLLQTDHLSRGLFLVLDGELALTAPCGCTETIDTRAGFFLFPSSSELDEAAGRTATPRRPSLTVFIPRTLALLDAEVGQLIAGLLVREASLRAPHDSAAVHP